MCMHVSMYICISHVLSSGTKGTRRIAYSSLNYMEGSYELWYGTVFYSKQAHVFEAQLHIQDNKQVTG